MTTFRIALANVRYPATPDESVLLAEEAIAQAGGQQAGVVCFPECFVPGYRGAGQRCAASRRCVPRGAPGPRIAAAAKRANVAVVLGTERIVDGAPVATALVIDRDGTIAGFQDKVQVDPSEDPVYRRALTGACSPPAPLTFGVVICHEGWRYPETVRWAVRRGAQVVFHPHFHEAEPGGYRPVTLRRPREHVPREGGAVPRRGEHVLLRDGELCERGIADHIRGGESRRDAADASAVRRGRTPDRGPRPRRRDGPARVAVQVRVVRSLPSLTLGMTFGHILVLPSLDSKAMRHISRALLLLFSRRGAPVAGTAQEPSPSGHPTPSVRRRSRKTGSSSSTRRRRTTTRRTCRDATRCSTCSMATRTSTPSPACSRSSGPVSTGRSWCRR